MRKKQLLFVTYHDENFDEGLSYAVDLAKTMNDGISILMIYKRAVMEKFEDLMAVVTFAEAGEHKTAREMIKEDYKKHNKDYEEKLAQLVEKCRKAGSSVDVGTASMDVVSAIRNLVRQNTSIDMVLLSPSITNDSTVTAKELNRLVKSASRPVVTMAKNISAA